MFATRLTRPTPRTSANRWPRRLGPLSLASCLVLAQVSGLSAADRRGLSATDLVGSDQVLVIAHRGDSREAPENTLPAFAAALAAGADLVELDYHHTFDGVPVVLHDFTLNRTTNAGQVFPDASLKVVDRSLADLARLDAGSWFHKRFAATQLPTLEASLDLIQTQSTTLIERKAGAADTCLELLRRKNLVPRVVVQSFDWNYLVDCHRLCPELVMAALGHGELDDQRWSRLAQTGARIVAWHHNDVDRQKIDEIHRRGYRAWVFTVNDLPRAAELRASGIDGIITDIPRAVRQHLAEAASAAK